MVGAWRLTRIFRHDCYGKAWKIDAIATLAAFALATALLAFVIYSQVIS